MPYVVAKEDAEPAPPQLSPPGEIRRGSARLALFGAIVLAIGRALLWHGKETATIAAFAVSVLLLYTLFFFVQTLFGFSINEMYTNFWRLPGRLKATYLAMILVTILLLIASCGFLFPGIGDKI